MLCGTDRLHVQYMRHATRVLSRHFVIAAHGDSLLVVLQLAPYIARSSQLPGQTLASNRPTVQKTVVSCLYGLTCGLHCRMLTPLQGLVHGNCQCMWHSYCMKAMQQLQQLPQSIVSLDDHMHSWLLAGTCNHRLSRLPPSVLAESDLFCIFAVLQVTSTGHQASTQDV